MSVLSGNEVVFLFIGLVTLTGKMGKLSLMLFAISHSALLMNLLLAEKFSL